MNIFIHEMRMERKSLLTWIISLIGMTGLFMALYPALSAQMYIFMQLLESFPIEIQEALGMSNFRYGGVFGYYSFILTYVLLAGSIQAMNLGLSILSEEVRDKTADFLYTKPVSRQKIITSKLAAIFMQLFIANGIYVIAARTILSLVSPEAFDLKVFLLLTCSLVLIQIFFACLGLFVSSFLKRIRTVLPISMGVVFFFYILFVLNQTLKNPELAFLSPFSYFEMNKILASGAYELKYVITMVLLGLLFIVSTYHLYTKKDLPSI